MNDLTEYLQSEAARRYALGSADCVTLAAGWIARSRGVDPMAALPPYGDERGALALVSCWGGLARAMGRAARRSGLAMTRNPGPGDVALVIIRGGAAVAAIRSTNGWVMRLDTGMAMLPPASVRVVAAWSL